MFRKSAPAENAAAPSAPTPLLPFAPERIHPSASLRSRANPSADSSACATRTQAE